MTRSKQGLLAVAAAFALFAIYTDPQGSGEAVQSGLSVVGNLVQGVFSFFGAVLS